MALADVVVRVVGETSDAEKDLKGIGKKVGGLSGTVGKLGGAIAGAFAVSAVVDFGKEAVDAASRLEQAAGATEQIWGATAAQVEGYADGAAENLGIANAEYLEHANILGSLVTNSGFVEQGEAAAEVTNDMVERAADMAATFGGSTTEAVNALSSAMKGNYEQLDRYAAGVTATEVKQHALNKGIWDGEGAMTDAEKQAAALELIYAKTATTAGQFGREADTVAGKQQRLTAKFEEAKAEIGNALIPIVLTLFDAVEPLIPVFVDLVTALAPILVLIGQLLAPVAKLVGALVSLLSAALTPLVGYLTAALEPILSEIGNMFGWLADQVSRLISWIGRIRWPSPPSFLSGFGFGGSSASYASSASLGGVASMGVAATRSVTRATNAVAGIGGGASINVYAGVADPVEVGRQVVAAISKYEGVAGQGWRSASAGAFV